MTDTELLEMLRRGDVLEALNGFMEQYHSVLIRYAENLIGRYEVPLTPDEVVSDVWARFVMQDARRNITSVKGILFSMVRTEVHQTWRRRSRLSSDSLPDVADPVSIENEVINRDEAAYLEREIIASVGLLNINQLSSLILRYKYNLPDDLIAQALDIKPESVPVLVSNAKKRIREHYTSPDYTPIQIGEVEELLYRLHDQHYTRVAVCAEHLGKQKAGSP